MKVETRGPDGTCSVLSCSGTVRTRGWCHKHYTRWRRHGSPYARKKIHGSFIDKFGLQVLIGDGCWDWLGNLSNLGYARVRLSGRRQYVHRLSYEYFVGPIPDGLEIDHLCRNRSCVNPDHLEAVTHAENLRRALGRDEKGRFIARQD